MKAALINTYGEHATFELAEVSKPEVKPGHVVVKVAASSVNTVDTMIRTMGKNLPLSPDTPAILGMDFAGTVEAVGDGVTHYSVGDEVYGCAGGLADLPGALAEYMVADADLIAKKPNNLSMSEAAALPLVRLRPTKDCNVQESNKVRKFWCMAAPVALGTSPCNLPNTGAAKSTPPAEVSHSWR